MREKQRVEQKIREEEREKEKIIAMEHCSRMDDLKMAAQTLSSTKKSLIDEIKSAIRMLNSVDEELKGVKSDALNLQKMNK